MTPDKKAVIFDWNGTLFADIKHAIAATNATIPLFGAKPASLRTYQNEFSMPLKDFYVRLGCDAKELDRRMDELFAVWGGHYDANVHKARLRRGARALLKELKANNHRAAILSNHTVSCITKQTKRLGIYEHFDAILANGEHDFKNIMHKADKGSRLKVFASRHEISKALVIGDSPEEIEIAHHYGFLGVGIAGGFCSADRIRAARPDFMINSLTQMPEIVRHVFGGGRGK